MSFSGPVSVAHMHVLINNQESDLRWADACKWTLDVASREIITKKSKQGKKSTHILLQEARFTQSCKPLEVLGPAGISECTMPRPAVIHCTSPALIVPRCPSKSSCVTAP
jgi:hypothetical protein